MIFESFSFFGNHQLISGILKFSKEEHITYMCMCVCVYYQQKFDLKIPYKLVLKRSMDTGL